MEERDYQTTAENAVITEYDKGVRRMMNVMATGTGKTAVFARLFKKLRSRLPGQMLVLAHTEELVDQNKETLELVNPEFTVSKEMAGEHAAPDSDIIVASVATLGRKDTKRVEKFDWKNIDKVVIDEAHHSTGDAYRRVLDVAGSMLPDTHKLLLGTTATPNRPDGTGLSEIFDKVVNVYSIRDAIKDGWLVDVKGWQIRTTTSLAGVSMTAGDFNKGELSEKIDTPVRNRQIVEAWQQYGGNRQTVAFCVDIQHAKDLAEEFKKAGVPAEAIWGDDPDRKTKLEAHQNGEFRVLCNCALLTEGYDDWRIACIILARPTVSSILFAQMVGRGLRLQKYLGKVLNLFISKKMGLALKEDCIVLDVVDSASRNTLLTLPTLMGVRSNFDLKGGSLFGAVQAMEAAMDKNPNLNLSKLSDLDGLKTLAEKVNLFEVRFPEEVEANSDLMWFSAVGGGYKMLIPKETSKAGFVHISENLLGKWDIVAQINDESLHGTRGSMEEAFKVADEQIRKRVNSKTLACVKREATWHKNPVSTGQKNLLAKLFPWKTFPIDQMTAGQASKIISEKLTKK